MKPYAHLPLRRMAETLMVAAVFSLAAAPLAYGAVSKVERFVEFDGLQTGRTDDGQWVTLHLPDAHPRVTVGEPAIPMAREVVPIPAGHTVTAVRLHIVEQEVLDLERPVVPFAGERTTRGEVLPPPVPDEVLYATAGLYPTVTAEFVRTFDLPSGLRRAVIEIHPLRADLKTGRVYWIRQARLVVETDLAEQSSSSLRRERPVLHPTPLGGGDDLRGTLLMFEAGFQPTQMPSLEGTPIEYVIISPADEDMVTAWQRLADWKTATGIPAVVVTTDWIEDAYDDAADQPEQIRMFLRDAYAQWNLKWALIGADAALIPCRYARSWAYNGSYETGTDIACDYYYACLEGSWDADQDGVMAEGARSENLPGGPQIGDNADLTPEIQVGRISARTGEEVDDYLDKYFMYVETPPLDGYLNRAYLLGEVLFDAEWSLFGLNGGPDCDGAIENCNTFNCRTKQVKQPDGSVIIQPICADSDGAKDVFDIALALDELGSPLDINLLVERCFWWSEHEYEGQIFPCTEESSTSSMAALNDGGGFVHQVGHGDRDRWAVGNGRLMMQDLGALTNGGHSEGGRFYWVYAVNCNSAAIDYDSFGEQMVLTSGHGAIAYIGCTNVDFPSTARSFSDVFYNTIFAAPGATLGDGFFTASATNVPTNLNQDNIYRFIALTMVLLGDPGMVVWHSEPSDLTVEFETAPALGIGTLEVSVSDGGPVAGARVCLHKEGELYVVALTDESGIAEVPFWPESEGDFTVTVTSPEHRPATEEGTVTASSSSPNIVLSTLEIVDDGSNGSAGNGNGVIEVGETVRLSLTVANEGTGESEDVSAALDYGDPFPAGCVTISDGSAAFGSVTGGNASSDEQAFLLEFAIDPPDSAFGDGNLIPLTFELSLSIGSTAFERELTFELARPHFGFAANQMTETTSEYYELFVGLTNDGTGTGSHLIGKVDDQSLYLELIGSGEAAIEELAPGATTLVGPYTLHVYSLEHAYVTFSVIDTLGGRSETLYTRVIDMQSPTAPDSLGVIGLPGAIVLGWSEATDPDTRGVAGYLVQRKAESAEEFEPAHDGLLTDHRYMTDSGLDQLASYSYQVAAMDSSGNVGAFSDVASAYTSPGMAEGWPNRLEVYQKSSPIIAELDKSYLSKREILFCGERLYGFHGDGVEIVDGDGVGSTAGPFSRGGEAFWAKPAIGDIDGDGTNEVLAVCFDTKKLYCWGARGRDPKWEISLGAGRKWHTPVLADLSTPPDGKLEVILAHGTTGSSGIYVYSHDGTPWTGSNGLLKNLYGYDLYHSPSVGDLDGDGNPEIVMTTRESGGYGGDGALWAIRPTGATVINQQRFSAIPIHGMVGQATTASPALADVDGVEGDEIFVVTPDRVWGFRGNGDLLWYYDLPTTIDAELIPEPAMGDINGDGDLDIAVVDGGGLVHAIKAISGQALWQFPVQVSRGDAVSYGSCIIANVDLDEKPEIIFGDGDKYVYAYTFMGEIARGFPIYLGGDMSRQSLAAWDTDMDGYQNLVVQANKMQQLTVLHLEGAVFDTLNPNNTNPWAMRYRDERNTGRYTDDGYCVPVMVSVEQALVSATGRVQLSWHSNLPVTSFRVYRSLAGEMDEELLGEIPGGSGQGAGDYLYEDEPPGPGLYTYRICPVDLTGVEQRGTTVTVEVGVGPRLALALQNVHPNPLALGEAAAITFTLPGQADERVEVALRVIDLEGRVVRTLVNDERPGGWHTTYWDGRASGGRTLPVGFYLLHLEADGKSVTDRMLLVH